MKSLIAPIVFFMLFLWVGSAMAQDKENLEGKVDCIFSLIVDYIENNTLVNSTRIREGFSWDLPAQRDEVRTIAKRIGEVEVDMDYSIDDISIQENTNLGEIKIHQNGNIVYAAGFTQESSGHAFTVQDNGAWAEHKSEDGSTTGPRKNTKVVRCKLNKIK